MKRVYTILALLIGFVQFIHAQNQFPTAKNSNVTIDGGWINMIRPVSTGGWARGVLFQNETKNLAGIGLLGNVDTLERIYISFGVTPWKSSTGIFILPSGNVGIGNKDPEYKLDVIGDIRLSRQIILPEANAVNNASPGLIGTARSNFLFKGKYINNYGFGFYKRDSETILRAYISDYYGVDFFTKGTHQMTITDDGYVGIGTANPDQKLTVNGNIHTKEVKVDLNIPADYVFQKYYTGISNLKEDYQLPSLEEIENFTRDYHHLPGMPSAGEIQENGLLLGEMNNLLLQKVEELTLYTIEQEKKIQTQAEEMERLKAEISEIRRLLDKKD